MHSTVSRQFKSHLYYSLARSARQSHTSGLHRSTKVSKEQLGLGIMQHEMHGKGHMEMSGDGHVISLNNVNSGGVQ